MARRRRYRVMLLRGAGMGVLCSSIRLVHLYKLRSALGRNRGQIRSRKWSIGPRRCSSVPQGRFVDACWLIDFAAAATLDESSAFEHTIWNLELTDSLDIIDCSKAVDRSLSEISS